MVKRAHSEEPVGVKRTRAALNAAPAPHERLDVFAFGSGTICELGLGPRVTEVKRPRLSPLLSADVVGVVALAAGGAHGLALDSAGSIWSWGQNDTGALARDTTVPEDDVDEDDDLNPLESTPARIDFTLPNDEKFVAVAASDSASAAISESGHVYAWGTFIDDGAKAFSSGVRLQTRPVRMPRIRNAVAIAGGKDHFLVLTAEGHVWPFGVGASFQLGKRVRASLRSRSRDASQQYAGTTTCEPFRLSTLRDIVHIVAGDFSSYAVDSRGRVFSWGLNNFGQCGISDPVGPNVFIEKPTHAPFWDDKQILQIAAGGHHSLWLTESGDVYSIGETNFHQLGVPHNELPDSTVREQDGTPSFVPEPIKIKKSIDGDEIDMFPAVKFIAAGTDHCLALSRDGAPYTWGFGAVYQLGHGKPPGEDGPEEEEIPRRIRNTATAGRNMTWAGAGGQFSLLASPAV